MTLSDLWQLAKTPMAAPETSSLKRLRYCWMILCILAAVSVGQIAFLKTLFGSRAGLIPLALLLCVMIVGWVYFRAKRSADDAWLYEERP